MRHRAPSSGDVQKHMNIELVQQSLFLCPHICLVWTHCGVGLNCICLVFWGEVNILVCASNKMLGLFSN